MFGQSLQASIRILEGNLKIGCWSLFIILIATTGHAGTGTEEPPLIQAVEAGRFAEVKCLLAAGADPTATTLAAGQRFTRPLTWVALTCWRLC